MIAETLRRLRGGFVICQFGGLVVPDEGDLGRWRRCWSVRCSWCGRYQSVIGERPHASARPNILVALAALHAGFLVLEMFLWTTPFGLKTFNLTPEFAAASRALAANQGLYNGFLAAGLSGA